MNFQDLMNRATQNSRNTSLQQRKSGHHHKDNTPGVSSAAVHAFLAKKQQLEQKRQAEQDAARRARVEARLEQSLQHKKGTKRKSSTETKTVATANHQTKEDEKVKTKKPKQTHEQSQKTTTKTPKTQESSTDKQSPQPTRPTTSTKKINKKKAPAPPPNFKELLAIAEMNKKGLSKKPAQQTNNVSKPVLKGESTNEQCDSKMKEKKRKQTNHTTAQDKTDITTIAKKKDLHKMKPSHQPTSSKLDKHKKSTQKDFPKPSLSTGKNGKPTEIGTSSKTHNKTAAGDTKFLSKSTPKTNQSTDSRSVSKPKLLSSSKHAVAAQYRMMQEARARKKQVDPYATYNHKLPRRGMALKRQHQSYYGDEEDDYDDMDGFIDDGDDEAAEDYSSHIREIFGYDRRRFDDDDFDDAAMESNYSQIEREENRSSKIAKLEDEIAFLKEQAELKREREKLLKGKKKLKK